MRISLLCAFVIFCLDASLVFGIESKVKEDEIKSRERVAGIWVLDKDKMQKEIEAVLKQAKVRAKELGIESAEEQLKRLEKSHQKNLEHVAMMIYHLADSTPKCN